jgi:hypothetical protein
MPDDGPLGGLNTAEVATLMDRAEAGDADALAQIAHLADETEPESE